jgi:hypothetical protein
MKQILLSIVFICSTYLLKAQVPQYVMIPPAATYFTNHLFNRPFDSNRHQFLYYPALEFPNVPAGFINNIYFKVGRKVTTPLTYMNLYIGMAHYTSEDDSMSFKSTPPPYTWYYSDTLLYSNYTFQSPIDSGDWVKIPLQRLFQYNPSKNFILDMLHYGNNLYPNGLNLEIASLAFGGTQCYGGSGNLFHSPGKCGYKFLIGFDLIPLSVNNAENLINFSLYPNPCTGKYSVNFYAQKKIDEGMITVTNLTGGRVFQELIQNITGNFSKEIDISNMSKGVYFVELRTNGERVVKRLIVE